MGIHHLTNMTIHELLNCAPDLKQYIKWDRLVNHEWIDLLTSSTQYDKECNWNNLDSATWCTLLLKDARFYQFFNVSWVDRFSNYELRQLITHKRDFMKFMKHDNWNSLNHKDWRLIIIKYPNLFSICDPTIFDALDWRHILECHPNFKDRADWLTILKSPNDWNFLHNQYKKQKEHQQFMDDIKEKCQMMIEVDSS